MNPLIYDLEIKNAIRDKRKDPIPDIKYCGGWGDHVGMGISVLAAADYQQNRSRVFMDDNKDAFEEAVESADLIVTFNGESFDNKVVEACWKIKISLKPQYDIYKKIRAVVGRFGSYKLDAICKANFGVEKNGDGAMAPILWQQGKVGEVIDYCLNDEKMTQMVFEKIRNDGFLISPVDGTKIHITI